MLISVDRASIWFYINFVCNKHCWCFLSMVAIKMGLLYLIVFILIVLFTSVVIVFHKKPKLMSAIVRKNTVLLMKCGVGYACTQTNFRQIAHAVAGLCSMSEQHFKSVIATKCYHNRRQLCTNTFILTEKLPVGIIM